MFRLATLRGLAGFLIRRLADRGVEDLQRDWGWIVWPFCNVYRRYGYCEIEERNLRASDLPLDFSSDLNSPCHIYG